MNEEVKNLLGGILGEVTQDAKTVNITININAPSTDHSPCCDGEGCSNCLEDDEEGFEKYELVEGGEDEVDDEGYRKAWRILSTLTKIQIPDCKEKKAILNLMKQLEENLDLEN